MTVTDPSPTINPARWTNSQKPAGRSGNPKPFCLATAAVRQVANVAQAAYGSRSTEAVGLRVHMSATNDHVESASNDATTIDAANSWSPKKTTDQPTFKNSFATNIAATNPKRRPRFFALHHSIAATEDST